MDRNKKQSQDMFDGELRREMQEAEDAQKRVWEKIQKMSPEERRKMAAGVPGPEEREELPAGMPYGPLPRRRLGSAIKVGALAAVALLVVISSGTFSIGNKEHEYHVIENSNGIVNNDDTIESSKAINNRMAILCSLLNVQPVLFDYWPENIKFSSQEILSENEYGIIECTSNEKKIYIEIHKNHMDYAYNIAENAEFIKEIENSKYNGNIKLYKTIQSENTISYIGVILNDNNCFCISGFQNEENLIKVLESVRNKEN